MSSLDDGSDLTGKTAAVKVLHAQLHGDTDAMKDMRTEVALLSSLQHPNLIEVRDCDCRDSS